MSIVKLEAQMQITADVDTETGEVTDVTAFDETIQYLGSDGRPIEAGGVAGAGDEDGNFIEDEAVIHSAMKQASENSWPTAEFSWA
jgi:hypothetical protein